MDEGAGEKSALEFADEIQFLGASLGLSTGKDYSSIDLQVLRRNFGTALELFSDILLRPAFSEKEWERVKRLSLNSLKQRGERPTSVARVVGDRLYYGEHPYAHPEDGYSSTVQNISLEDARKAYSAALSPGNCVLLITGDFEPAALRGELEKHFAGWKGPPARLPEKAIHSPGAGRLARVGQHQAQNNPKEPLRLALADPGEPPCVGRVDGLFGKPGRWAFPAREMFFKLASKGGRLKVPGDEKDTIPRRQGGRIRLPDVFQADALNGG